jgi:hypothetical protein
LLFTIPMSMAEEDESEGFFKAEGTYLAEE